MLIGLSDVPAESMVKVYCPKCVDVYTPKSSRHHHIDGVYFGTGFPHMLFMVHPELRPPKPTNQFVPRYIVYMLCVCVCVCTQNLESLGCVLFLTLSPSPTPPSLHSTHNTHTLLHLSAGQIVWLQDPPPGLPAAATGCRQEPLQHLKTTIPETNFQIEHTQHLLHCV